MAEFKIYRDRKSIVWGRETIWQEAETKEQAVDLAIKRMNADGPDDFEFLPDTEILMSPYEIISAGDFTEEIMVDEESFANNKPEALQPNRESILAAKEVLRNAGYFVDNLWCVEDVKHKFDVDDSEAMAMLEECVANDYIIERINITISERGSEYGHPEAKHENDNEGSN